MSYIVGIIGMARAGKDEIGKVFTEDYGFKRYAFGDEVKYQYAASIGANPEDMFNENKTKNRPGIIDYGEGKRKDNPNYWIDEVREDIYTDMRIGNSVVITDMRRVPEIDYLIEMKKRYGNNSVFLIYVNRPESNGQTFDDDAETAKAILYAQFKNAIDITLYNNHDTETLAKFVTHIIDSDIMKKIK